MNNDDILDLLVMQDDRINCYHGYLTHDSYIVARYPLIHLVEIDKRTESYGFEAYDSWDNHEMLGNWTRAVEIGDTDQDGKPEAIVGTFDNNVYTFEQVANNTYRRAWRSNDIYQITGSLTIQWPSYADAQDVVIGDQDQDGKMEIIVAAAERIFVFENTGNDIYELVWQSGAIVTENVLGYKKSMTQYTRPPLTEITALAVDYDLDNDNASEIIGGIDGWFFAFECTGDNNYSLIWKTLRPPYTGYVAQIYDIVTGDTDQDGFREILLVGADEKYNEYGEVILAYSWFEVYENYENVTYSTRDNMFSRSFDSGETWALPGAAYSVALGDHNYNGIPEIFMGTTYWIHIFESNGDNSYIMINPLVIQPMVPTWSIAVGNTDGDSYQEIIAGVGNQLMVFEQDWTLAVPNNNYTKVWNSSQLAERITDIAIGDTNKNNITEILVSAMRGNVYSFEWLLNATASAPAELAQSRYQISLEKNVSQSGNDVELLCITEVIGGRRR
jgi:hypothetical protein